MWAIHLGRRSPKDERHAAQTAGVRLLTSVLRLYKPAVDCDSVMAKKEKKNEMVATRERAYWKRAKERRSDLDPQAFVSQTPVFWLSLLSPLGVC